MGFFRWVFWVFLGGFFIANPAYNTGGDIPTPHRNGTLTRTLSRSSFSVGIDTGVVGRGLERIAVIESGNLVALRPCFSSYFNSLVFRASQKRENIFIRHT